MAHYNVTFKCGHTGRVDVVGPLKNRQYWIDRKASRLCPDCYAEDYRIAREAENARAAEDAKSAELPVLTGSEKQVGWATTIRQSKLADAKALIEKYRTAPDFDEGVASSMIESFKKIVSASWWIDHRNESVRSLIGKMMK